MKRLAVLLMLCASPAFAQYLTPASGVQLRLESQFTGSCSTTNPPVGIARDTGNQFCCIAGSWIKCGASASAFTVLTEPSTGRILHKPRYEDLDTNGDGTIDVRIVGDYDGDGTLYYKQDIVAAYDNLVSGKTARFDTDGDGTLDSVGVHLVILPGTYRAGFHDTLDLSLPGVEISGYGPDQSIIKVDADCDGTQDFNGDGTVDALDNKDNSQGFGFLFKLNANHLSVHDLGFDGGSNQYAYTHLLTTDPNFCDANDIDGDGTGNINDACPCDATKSVAPCNTNCSDAAGHNSMCVTRWCTNDEHFIFTGPSGVTHNKDWRIYNIRVRRADSNVFEEMQEQQDIAINNIDVKNSGEESAEVVTGMKITNSRFENCGNRNSDCLTLRDSNEAARDILIRGNEFVNCAGKCIMGNIEATETLGQFGNIVIADNVFKTTGTETMIGPVISIASAQATPVVSDGITITGNTINVAGMKNSGPIYVGSGASSTAFRNVVVSNNAITYTPEVNIALTHAGIDLRRVDGASVVGNTIDVTGDFEASASGQEEFGIYGYNSTNLVIGNNWVKLRGEGVMGIGLNGCTYSTINGNLFDASAVTSLTNIALGTTTNRMGMWLYGSTNNTVTGNRWTGPATISVGLYGTYLYNATDSNIANNRFDQCYNCIFNATAGAVRNQFFGNICKSTTAQSSYCFSDQAAAGANLWSGNSAYSGYRAGTINSESANIVAGAGFALDPDCDSNGTASDPCVKWHTGSNGFQPTDTPATCTATINGAEYFDLSLGEKCFCKGSGPTWCKVSAPATCGTNASCG